VATGFAKLTGRIKSGDTKNLDLDKLGQSKRPSVYMAKAQQSDYYIANISEILVVAQLRSWIQFGLLNLQIEVNLFLICFDRLT
jgi:hypothetical protein